MIFNPHASYKDSEGPFQGDQNQQEVANSEKKKTDISVAKVQMLVDHNTV